MPDTPPLTAALTHIRDIASGFGGDEASRSDPHNALATIVILCDEALDRDRAARDALSVERLAEALHALTWLSHGLPPEAECGYCARVAERLRDRLAALAASPSRAERLEAVRNHLAYDMEHADYSEWSWRDALRHAVASIDAALDPEARHE